MYTLLRYKQVANCKTSDATKIGERFILTTPEDSVGAAACMIGAIVTMFFVKQRVVCCWGCCHNRCYGLCALETNRGRRSRTEHAPKRGSDKTRARAMSSVDLMSLLSTRDYYIRFSQIGIGKRIAAGGHGRVYKGTFGGQDVCCKELFTTVSDDQDLAEFENEARLMLKISHPNIVRLFGFSTRPMPELPDKTSFFLISEFCHGGSIRDVLETHDAEVRRASSLSARSVDRARMLKPERLYRWSVDICNAMSFLHRRDMPIAHLDLKPGNILLTSSDLSRATIKICDLGTARALRKNDDFIEVMEQKKIGTPAYMPPEMVSVYNASAHILATKVDVYEAGVTFGFMWSGVPPWNETKIKFSSELELLYERIVRGERPSIKGGPRKVPAEMIKILDAMQSHVPEDRPTFEKVAAMISEIAPMGPVVAENPAFEGAGGGIRIGRANDSGPKNTLLRQNTNRSDARKMINSGQSEMGQSYPDQPEGMLPRTRSYKGMTL
jgi:serine/threonine protein kinase